MLSYWCSMQAAMEYGREVPAARRKGPREHRRRPGTCQTPRTWLMPTSTRIALSSSCHQLSPLLPIASPTWKLVRFGRGSRTPLTTSVFSLLYCRLLMPRPHPPLDASTLRGKERKKYMLDKVVRLGGEAPKGQHHATNIRIGMNLKSKEREAKRKAEVPHHHHARVAPSSSDTHDGCRRVRWILCWLDRLPVGWTRLGAAGAREDDDEDDGPGVLYYAIPCCICDHNRSLFFILHFRLVVGPARSLVHVHGLLGLALVKVTCHSMGTGLGPLGCASDGSLGPGSGLANLFLGSLCGCSHGISGLLRTFLDLFHHAAGLLGKSLSLAGVLSSVGMRIHSACYTRVSWRLAVGTTVVPGDDTTLFVWVQSRRGCWPFIPVGGERALIGQLACLQTMGANGERPPPPTRPANLRQFRATGPPHHYHSQAQ